MVDNIPLCKNIIGFFVLFFFLVVVFFFFLQASLADFNNL